MVEGKRKERKKEESEKEIEKRKGEEKEEEKWSQHWDQTTFLSAAHLTTIELVLITRTIYLYYKYRKSQFS